MKLVLAVCVLGLLIQQSSQEAIVKVVTCEHSTAPLTCGANQVINVISGFYGRTDTTTCPAAAASMGNTSCHQPAAFDIIRAACKGKTSCTVSAENSVFTDPCVNTFKFMVIHYSCPVVQTASSCENQAAVSISCGSSQSVGIVSAMYGRQDSTKCPGGNQANTNCAAVNSTSIVKGICAGSPAPKATSSCSINPSNSVFGDPCVGTYKYLTVNYFCTDANVLGTCENTAALTPTCTGGKTVNVLSVLYGRTSANYCSGGNIFDTDCGAVKAIQVVTGLCQGKAQCSVEPNNGQFGDPCVNTFKYLIVAYSCA